MRHTLEDMTPSSRPYSLRTLTKKRRLLPYPTLVEAPPINEEKMRSNLRLYHKMFGQIRHWLPGERVTRQRNLALLVVGLYLAQSVYLTKID